MTTNTTIASAPATISRKELWALFADLKVKRGLNVGFVDCLRHPHEAEYIPINRLHSYGEFNELESLGECVAEVVADDDDPIWALNTIIDDLEGYLTDLRDIRDDFRHFASVLEADDDVPDDEVRYHRPSAAVDEQREAA